MIVEQDAGDEHPGQHLTEPETVTTMAELAEQFPFEVAYRCARCGQWAITILFGRSTFAGWIGVFQAEGAKPNTCHACKTEVSSQEGE